MSKKKSIRSSKNKGYYKDRPNVTLKNKKRKAAIMARKLARGITHSMRQKAKNAKRRSRQLTT